MYIFCNDHHFTQTNDRIATKLAHDGLQLSLRPRCAQGQGQGQRSRDMGTLVLARKSLLDDYWDTWNYSLFASSLQSTIYCISIHFARWQHDCGRSLLSTIASFSLKISWYSENRDDATPAISGRLSTVQVFTDETSVASNRFHSNTSRPISTPE